MKDFTNKVIVITGAASGIGQGLALQLAEKGGVIVLADINSDGLKQTAKMIESSGGRCKAYTVDVASRKAVQKFAQAVIKNHKQIDILINNAGVSLKGKLEHCTYENLEWIIGINLWGTIYCTKEFLPFLRERPEAHIVNLSSGWGLAGCPLLSAYSITKFAIRGLTESLRMELHGSNITVTLVHPGIIKTNIIRNSRSDCKNDPYTMEEAERRFFKSASMDAAQTASVIIKGIECGKTRILVGKESVFLSLFTRLRPATYDRLLLRFLKTNL